MKTVLVTGSTGFIGSNLVAELIRRGFSVRALYRMTSDTGMLNGLDVEHVHGDLLDSASLRRAMIGCDTVFHTAAVVSFWKGRKEEQFRVNIEGCRNIVEACLNSGIGTLVHTSSVAAIGYRTDGGISDEETAYNWGNSIVYRYTKHLAELEILQGVERGLRAIIVNPSIVIGPGDRNMHGGRLIIDVKRGRIPAFTSGGANIVGVRDVIDGHIRAADRGKPGERYILSGSNYTHRDLLRLIAERVHGRSPFIKIPSQLVTYTGNIFDILGRIIKREPPLTSELAANIIHYNWYSCEKAVRELGYHPSPVEQAITEAYEWYRQHALV
jgi:dihydroflavonol-4-reductase